MVSKMNIMCDTCLTNTNTIWYVLPWYLHYAYVKYMLRATMSESTIECTKCSCESIRVSSYSYLQIGFLNDIYSIICSVLG